MQPAIHNYKDAIRGDTIPGKRFTITQTIDGVTSPIDLSNVDVKSTFSTNSKNIKKTENNGITVVDAVNGVFDIDPFIIETTGTFEYDIQFTFSDGTIKTYIKGTIKISNDVTK